MSDLSPDSYLGPDRSLLTVIGRGRLLLRDRLRSLTAGVRRVKLLLRDRFLSPDRSLFAVTLCVKLLLRSKDAVGGAESRLFGCAS